MAALLILLLLVGACVLVAYTRREGQRKAHEQRAISEPLDPILSEVLQRPDHSRGVRAAENALRAATGDIYRVAGQQGENPVLALYSDDIVWSGLLVVTTGRTMLFSDGRLRTVSHLAGTSTSISGGPNETHMRVTVTGNDGTIEFSCGTLARAQLICGAIDVWVDSPTLRADPRVVITPRRVEIPDAFFMDTLRTAGHPVTSFNMRSLHERFGMQFINKARRYLDDKHGTAVGERFTRDYGRPADDAHLPRWPEQVLRGWIEIEPSVAPLAAFVPHLIRDFLLESPYLANPHRPLCMWKSDWYEDDGRGPRRRLGPGQPPIPA